MINAIIYVNFIQKLKQYSEYFKVEISLNFCKFSVIQIKNK